MSSSEAFKSVVGRSGAASGSPRRAALRALGLAVATGLAAGVAGCSDGSGFRPLYGSLGGSSVEQKLSQVEFAPIPGRNGQRIRNELMFKAYGGDTGKTAKYRLEVAVKESSTTTLVLRDGTSGGMIYQIDARFQLVDIATKQVMLEGMSQSRATSERFPNVFSNVRAADEAQERATKTIATDLKARLAGFLSTVQG